MILFRTFLGSPRCLDSYTKKRTHPRQFWKWCLIRAAGSQLLWNTLGSLYAALTAFSVLNVNATFANLNFTSFKKPNATSEVRLPVFEKLTATFEN